LLKGFFVPKKAKTQNAFNIGLAKNWLTDFNQLLFCYLALVPAEDKNLAGKRSINF